MDDNLVDHMIRTSKDVGEIKAGINNLVSYVGAVNKKVNEVQKDLGEHKLDGSAHGAKDKEEVKEKDWGKVMAYIMLGVTALDAASHFLGK